MGLQHMQPATHVSRLKIAMKAAMMDVSRVASLPAQLARPGATMLTQWEYMFRKNWHPLPELTKSSLTSYQVT